MFHARRPASIVAAMLLFLSGLDTLAAEPSQQAVDWGFVGLQTILRRAKDVEAARRSAAEMFRKWDVDGNGINEADRSRQRNTLLSQARVNQVRMWFARDLNGDGTISRLELERFFGADVRSIYSRIWSNTEVENLEGEFRRKRDEMVARALRTDTDKDGLVTIAEILSSVPFAVRAPERGDRLPPRYVDADEDGVVSETEFMAVIDKVLARVDQTGDGIFSPQERRQFEYDSGILDGKVRRAEREVREIENAAAMRDSCGIPKPPDDARVLMLLIHKGAALSSVGLGGDGEIATVGDVRVGPGEQPLYLVLFSFRPTIWRLTGATERVVQAVAGVRAKPDDGELRTGIMGISESLFFVPGRTECAQFAAANAQLSAKKTGALLGRTVEVLRTSNLHTVLLPMGVFLKEAPLPDAIEPPVASSTDFLWRAMTIDHPGGLLRLDADAIVSRAAVAPYEPLPGLAGLAELVARGAIEITEKSQVVKVGDGRRIAYEIPRKILIREKIRLPAGLSTAPHIYELAPGVPPPDNLPSNAKVVQHER